MKIIVASLADPVGRAVAERLGPGDPTSWRIGKDALTHLSGDRFLLRREALHIEDERLAEEFPTELAVQIEALIFPSVHRSASDRPALTVHPLGNLTAACEVGGRPSELDPVPARLMTEAFLRLRELGSASGVETTFESTHHGPWLRHPSFFIEIGSTPTEWERADLLDGMARILGTLAVDSTREDRVVLGVGGGHYVPRFRDLVRKRKVSVGHLVPAHHWAATDREMVEQLVSRTPGVEGVVYAAPGLAQEGKFTGLLPTLEERELSLR